MRASSSPDSGATRFFSFKLARPANQTASQSAWQPRIIWIYPRTSLTPAAVSCVPEITDTEAVARAQRDSSSDGNAVTSAAVHRARFAPSQAHERPLRRLRWLLLICGLGVRFPRGALSPSVEHRPEPSRATTLQTIGEVNTEYQPPSRGPAEQRTTPLAREAGRIPSSNRAGSTPTPTR